MAMDNDARHEWIEERAAILEYDAGFPRVEAENAAEIMWKLTVERAKGK